MGATPIYNLPYPELADPPNPPLDIKELADAVETILSKQTPLPSAKVNYLQADQALTSTSMVEIPRAQRVTLTNPSAQAAMQVRLICTGWFIFGSGTNTLYLNSFLQSGQATSIWTLGPRRGGASLYEEFFVEQGFYMPIGATATFGLQARKLYASPSVTLRNVTVAVLPVAFMSPSIPPYPNPNPPDPA